MHKPVCRPRPATTTSPKQAHVLAKELVLGLRDQLNGNDAALGAAESTSKLLTTLDTVANDDYMFDLAVNQYDLYSVVQALLRQEADCCGQTNYTVSSWTQHLTSSLFKGDRTNTARFHCMCPDRTKAFILSSPTAWDAWMDAAMILARRLTTFTNPQRRQLQQITWVHRIARDVLVALNLALIHKPVAQAIFVGETKTLPAQQDEYAMSLCQRLAAMFENGFAGNDIDHNQTIEANVFDLAARLEYWYRNLSVGGHGREDKFLKNLHLNKEQMSMYNILSKPMAEGSIEMGRTLTMQETQDRTRAAMRDMNMRGN